MKALIVCGGFGTRLNIYKPKCLVKINNKPLLEFQISVLNNVGITDITLLTGYKSEMIENLNLDCNIINTGTNGTCDALRKANITDRTLVLYGDIVIDCDLNKFIKSDTDKIVHLGVHKTSHPSDSDIVFFNNNNIITKVVTKPHNLKEGYSNCCLFLTDYRINDFLNCYDFGKDVLPKLVNKASVYDTNSLMLDIGTPKRLDYANRNLKE